MTVAFSPEFFFGETPATKGWFDKNVKTHGGGIVNANEGIYYFSDPSSYLSEAKYQYFL